MTIQYYTVILILNRDSVAVYLSIYTIYIVTNIMFTCKNKLNINMTSNHLYSYTLYSNIIQTRALLAARA